MNCFLFLDVLTVQEPLATDEKWFVCELSLIHIYAEYRQAVADLYAGKWNKDIIKTIVLKGNYKAVLLPCMSLQ